MASSTAASTFPYITAFVSVKLDGPNYLMWLNQFLLVLRSNDLLGIVDGSELCPNQFLRDDQGKDTTTVNPAFVIWTKKDQSL
jgi:hypothetical protein